MKINPVGLYTILLLTLFTVGSCKGSKNGSGNDRDQETTRETQTRDPLKEVILLSPDGEQIRASLAYTSQDLAKGLQYVRPGDFDEDQGKLFFYLTEGTRTFWMPNTFFNLDIIYLDEDLRITDIVWNLESHEGNEEPIPRAPAIHSRHVLEMKAGSPISSRLKEGDTLRWKSSLSLPETEREIRERL